MALASMYALIAEELAANRPLRESMDRIISGCSMARPHSDWNQLCALPYENLDELRAWIERPFRLNPPKKNLAGLWFGLFNPINPDGKPVADIYVCGSTRFDPNPNDNAWAVRPAWRPANGQAESRLLAHIHGIAYRKGGLGNAAEYPLCLAYGALAVRELLGGMNPYLVLGNAESVGVAVGFDSGDFVLVGRFTEKGLIPVELAAQVKHEPVELVLEALRSVDVDAVFWAIQGISKFKQHARSLVPELVRIARTHEKSALRDSAVRALAALAPDDPEAKVAILQALNDNHPAVRREALQALISVPLLTREELDRIKEMEHDPDNDVARWSEIALRNIHLREQSSMSKET